MFDDSKRRRGKASWYLNGSRLICAPSEPDDRFGPYSHDQLIRMGKRSLPASNAPFVWAGRVVFVFLGNN